MEYYLTLHNGVADMSKVSFENADNNANAKNAESFLSF